MPDAAPSPEEESNVIDQPPPKPAEPKEEVIVRAGRRRGRRQVMKKETVKDEEGYLGEIDLGAHFSRKRFTDYLGQSPSKSRAGSHFRRTNQHRRPRRSRP
ncbi:hypothetical protein BO82DRAFT_350701 [Aspergillus uvarum CBS 121591]|uniref:Uncharacterized protein n=1 Tax=Aspergillus uvarum CBS 121591 TaxID=1448315 RepID=A0A319E496_9EURO|nr:hypothetical protein BO82DRAFT_350701 [Aspergillus uvarum CBS 121591]PYH85912.1 hypothetical protein BO82DRAFT_350701 [Aspergillus uvarum CBS 121591]